MREANLDMRRIVRIADSDVRAKQARPEREVQDAPSHSCPKGECHGRRESINHRHEDFQRTDFVTLRSLW